MVSVSGSNFQAGMNTGWSVGSKYLQQAGVDSKYTTHIGNVLNGNTDGMITGATDGIIDNLVSDPVANAAIKGAVDIVKTVLLNQYNNGQSTQEAKTDVSNFEADAQTNMELGDEAQAEVEEIKNETNAQAEQIKGEVEEVTNNIVDTNEQSEEEILQLNEQNIANNEIIEANKEELEAKDKEIQEEQQKQEELKTEIEQRKEEIHNSSPAPAKVNTQPERKPVQAPQKPEGNDGTNGSQGNSGTSGTQGNTDAPAPEPQPKMSGENVTDDKLKGLIEEYNESGETISDLSESRQEFVDENVELTEEVQENSETIESSFTDREESVASNEEQINQLSDNFVSLYNGAQSAAKEVQNLLNGQVPKMDKVAMIKMTTQMTKSAVCGTNGGILAAAATAMGVSSIVSFGSTAEQTAKLSQASGSEFEGMAQHALANAAEKIIQQQVKNYLNQTLNNIGQMAGADLSQISEMMNCFIDDSIATKTASNEQFENNTADVERPAKEDEEDKA